MTLSHAHHHHDHRRDHDHGQLASAERVGWSRFACLVIAEAGKAVVVTRFGDPVRVVTHPGFTWRIPSPVEDTIAVDLRLRTTLSGLQVVGTRDGLRVLVQVYVAWQVPDDPDHDTQFLRAVRNDPDAAAQQLRTLLGSVLET